MFIWTAPKDGVSTHCHLWIAFCFGSSSLARRCWFCHGDRKIRRQSSKSHNVPNLKSQVIIWVKVPAVCGCKSILTKSNIATVRLHEVEPGAVCAAWLRSSLFFFSLSLSLLRGRSWVMTSLLELAGSLRIMSLQRACLILAGVNNHVWSSPFFHC